jgi:hypothetical protein
METLVDDDWLGQLASGNHPANARLRQSKRLRNVIFPAMFSE